MNYSNVFYFKKICAIGGTEQFLYEIAKKYNDYDITILYDKADQFQIKRLKKYVRCKKHIKGEKIVCKRAFFNFNIDAIDDIESTENYYCFVAHANFEEIGYKPPINNPKLNHFIGVSKWASEKLKIYAERLNKKTNVECCYNPLTLEPKEKVLRIVSATRLDDSVKGGKRTLQLIEALDRYCERTGKHYIWEIFTNTNIQLESKNVCIMKPRVDVRPYIADADIVVQLSNDMETYCYTINEAWSYGVKTVTTPFSVLKELPITEDMTIICEFDMSNIDEVVEKMFEPYKEIKYESPKDRWLELIDKTKSDYKEELNMKVKVRCIENFTDVIANTKRIINDEWIVDKERADYLIEDRKLCELVEIIKEQKKEDKKKPTPKKEKAII